MNHGKKNTEPFHKIFTCTPPTHPVAETEYEFSLYIDWHVVYLLRFLVGRHNISFTGFVSQGNDLYKGFNTVCGYLTCLRTWRSRLSECLWSILYPVASIDFCVEAPGADWFPWAAWRAMDWTNKTSRWILKSLAPCHIYTSIKSFYQNGYH